MVDFFAFSAPSHTKRAKSDYWAESAFSARVLIGTHARAIRKENGCKRKDDGCKKAGKTCIYHFFYVPLQPNFKVAFSPVAVFPA